MKRLCETIDDKQIGRHRDGLGRLSSHSWTEIRQEQKVSWTVVKKKWRSVMSIFCHLWL